MSKYWRSPWPRGLASNKSFKSLPCQVFTEELGNWNGHDLGINPMSREVSTLSRSTITTGSTPAFYYILCTQTNYCFFEEDPLFYLVIFKSLGQMWKFATNGLVLCFQNCSDLLWEKIVLLKFEAEGGREFSKKLRSLD